MYAILLLAMGQCGPYSQGPSWSDLCRTPGYAPSGPYFYSWALAPASPWNAAVAELRQRGKVRSRDRSGGLPASTREKLADLALTTEQLYATLCRAPPSEKAELRALWITARRDLERARLLASRELP